MKVAVFGATGTVGRLAVIEMLAEGHEVTAFARDPQKLKENDPRLTRFAGDALHFEDVAAAIKGQDAVVVTLGAGTSRNSHVRSAGTMNVIRAMQRHGVRRLICQSTLGTHESWDNLNFFWKRIMFGALLRPVFKDHELQEQLVRASGLDWTIVRPSAFTDGPGLGNFIEDVPTSARRLTLKITRADVASFLSRQLHDTVYIERAVGLSS
ncbi:NmrA family transcriptional regulator [Devosia pacifica]|uniref:NmrA family transcriptional regulator n=1 Tax=Devosia pacifica TaxID=1335967 RepID=A0A918RV13_9HYPH|nr:SDR family oxidoreductase [Devosia pacifica]GHA12231.1 NmrA family transcriptional regulator [Devosia pacifica]